MTVASRHGATEQTAVATTPWAAPYGAAAWATVFGMLHCYWALGGTAGLEFATGAEAEEAALQRDPAFVLLGLWGVGALCFVAAAISLIALRPQVSRLRRRALLWGAGGAAALLLARALFGFVESGAALAFGASLLDDSEDSWHVGNLAVWSPWFLAGAALFARVALSARSPGYVPQPLRADHAPRQEA